MSHIPLASTRKTNNQDASPNTTKRTEATEKQVKAGEGEKGEGEGRGLQVIRKSEDKRTNVERRAYSPLDPDPFVMSDMSAHA